MMKNGLHDLNNAELQVHSHISMQAIVDFKRLSSSDFFINVDAKTLLSILSVMQRERWPRDYRMARPGQINSRFFLLIKGRVKIVRHHADNGRELTLFLLGPGNGFNVLNLIDGGGRDLQINTLDEVEVLSAPTTRWLSWLEESPVLRKNMADVAAKHIERLSDLASELALDDTMTRLIHLLQRYFSQPHHEMNLLKDLPQEELANMIGTVRPVVSRLLGELKREGLIDMSNGELHVRNLQQMLNKVDGSRLHS
jgi:CRP-like cAMP-binding protein